MKFKDLQWLLEEGAQIHEDTTIDIGDWINAALSDDQIRVLWTFSPWSEEPNTPVPKDEAIGGLRDCVCDPVMGESIKAYKALEVLHKRFGMAPSIIYLEVQLED